MIMFIGLSLAGGTRQAQAMQAAKNAFASWSMGGLQTVRSVLQQRSPGAATCDAAVFSQVLLRARRMCLACLFVLWAAHLCMLMLPIAPPIRVAGSARLWPPSVFNLRHAISDAPCCVVHLQ